MTKEGVSLLIRSQVTLSGDRLEVIVDNKTATIDLSSLGVSCQEDPVFQQMVTTAVAKLHHSLVPAEPNK